MRKSTRTPPLDRVAPKIEFGDCWTWTGARDPSGYGRVKGEDARTHLAHRYVWELFVEPVAPHLDLDHLCRNRACVNPDHLEPVTRQENVARGLRGAGNPQMPLTCKAGHLWADGNVKQNGPNPRMRVCRTCQNRRNVEWRARRKARAALNREANEARP